MPITKRTSIGIITALGAAGLALICYSAAPPSANRQPIMVSIVQLIATPERYDGKLVVVVGYLTYGGPDGDALSLGKDDYENGVGDGLLVVRTKEMWRDRERLYDMYVGVTGVFRANREPETTVSHPAGLITDIRGCAFVSDPRHPMVERLKGLPGVQVGPPKR